MKEAFTIHPLDFFMVNNSENFLKIIKISSNYQLMR